MALKNTSEALFNRNQILDSFEQAQNTGNEEERKRLMTFAIVGGGATGIDWQVLWQKCENSFFRKIIRT